MVTETHVRADNSRNIYIHFIQPNKIPQLLIKDIYVSSLIFPMFPEMDHITDKNQVIDVHECTSVISRPRQPRIQNKGIGHTNIFSSIHYMKRKHS